MQQQVSCLHTGACILGHTGWCGVCQSCVCTVRKSTQGTGSGARSSRHRTGQQRLRRQHAGGSEAGPRRREVKALLLAWRRRSRHRRRRAKTGGQHTCGRAWRCRRRNGLHPQQASSLQNLEQLSGMLGSQHTELLQKQLLGQACSRGSGGRAGSARGHHQAGSYSTAVPWNAVHAVPAANHHPPQVCMHASRQSPPAPAHLAAAPPPPAPGAPAPPTAGC